MRRHPCGWATAASHLVVVVLLVIAAGESRPQPLPEDAHVVVAFTRHLDDHVPRLMNRLDVPGVAIALLRDGERAWSGAYGHADLEHDRKMTLGAIFRVESISKSVTAWGVMKLVEEGLIDLDAPIQRYLGNWKIPASKYSEEEATVRRLLSHDAGLSLGTIGMEYPPRGDASTETTNDMPTLRETLSGEVRFVREPGSGFSYSNTGFNLLELLIEEVTGRNFSEYMANEVLIPLGMNHASFVWSERLLDDMPTGYDLKGTPVSAYVYPVKASGGLFAPVEDVARFVQAEMTGPHHHANQTVLGQAALRALHVPRVAIPGLFGIVADAYGFGHFVETLTDGRQAVWHGGQGHGWMAHFHAVPDSGDGIVILTNSQRSWPLIAEILRDWGEWSGVGSVKMSRISYGAFALRVLIGVITLVSLWQLHRVILGLRSGHRRFAPSARNARPLRLGEATLGFGLIAALGWSAAQPYLIVSSIFPGSARWAGAALLFLAVIMILSASLPRIGRSAAD